jgi:hypothetical protein
MATGRLGAQDLTSTGNTEIYSVPASTFAVVTVNLANRGSSAVTVRIAVATTTSPGNSEWIEYDSSLSGYGVLERTGIVMDASKKIIVAAGTANQVTAMVYGIETSTS